MRVIPDQDSRDLAAMCRSLLTAELEPAAQWKALAEAGVLGLAIDERHGGSGGSLGDLGTFSVEAGRALCPMAVHSTVRAALAIDWLGTAEVRAARLPGLASGATRGTIALFSARDAAVVTPALQARPDGDGWRLSGVADFVADADVADVLVVTAQADKTTLTCVVETESPGIAVESMTIMGRHPAFTVHFDDVLVDGGVPVSDQQLRRVANAVVALDCLDLVGVGEAVVQRTVDHTKMREQFGRPIASFQAAQHLVADMHIALAAARLAAQSAVFWIGRGRTATRETAVARMRAAEVKKITLDAHQLHGGMGYVVDTGLHLFSERARILSTLGGGADIAAKWLEGEMDWGGRR
jgi:alkylation response protein AidB-like acyl-CoA dehydrogenase